MAGFGRGAEAAELLLDQDDFVAERLDALERQSRRATLDGITTMGAAVEIDLSDRGPLFHYLSERRDEAAAAMLALVEVDPKDAVAVATAQARVTEYLRVTRWIKQRREEAAEADRAIKEDYGFDDRQADQSHQD